MQHVLHYWKSSHFWECWRCKQLTIFWLPWFFLFFSNSKVNVLPKFCNIFVIYFPKIHLWVTLYFWCLPHKYKLFVLIFRSKVLIFFLLSQTSLFWTFFPVPCNFEKVGVDCSYVLTKHCLNILNKGYKKISCFSSTFWKL